MAATSARPLPPHGMHSTTPPRCCEHAVHAHSVTSVQDEDDPTRAELAAARGVYGQHEMRLATHEIHVGDMCGVVDARLDAIAAARPADPGDALCKRLDAAIAEIEARLAPGSAAAKAREQGVRARFQGTSRHAVAQDTAEREAAIAQQLAWVRTRMMDITPVSLSALHLVSVAPRTWLQICSTRNMHATTDSTNQTVVYRRQHSATLSGRRKTCGRPK